MEGLTRLKRDRAPEKEEEWGQEELSPGEGENLRHLAMAAYQKLQKERMLYPSVRTNPKYMAITMLLKERGSTERDGMKARLLRDYKLKTTVDLSATARQHEALQGLLDNRMRPARGSWQVLESTLSLQHDKVWPCVARGMVFPRAHTHDAPAIGAIMRVLSPMRRGKDFTTRMDDRPSDDQLGYSLATCHNTHRCT